MKKYLISITSVLVFAICCMMGVTAQAADPVEIAGVSVSGTYTYTGEEIIPTLVVTDTNGDEVAAEGYTATCTDNVNAGTATVSVEAVAPNTGSATTTFTIDAKSISSAKVDSFKLIAGQSPALTVKDGTKKLTEGVDYTVTVTNGANAGKTATVAINGIGNYAGTKSYSKIAYPAKVNGIKGSDRTTSSIIVKWNSLSAQGVTGYKVYKCSNAKGEDAKLVATVSGTSKKITGLKAGSYLYLKIRSYVKVGDKTYYGDYSKVYKTSVLPAKVIVNSASKSSDKTKLKVKWNKVACTGYEIQYTTDKSFKSGIKTVTAMDAKTTSKSITIPSNNKVYYVRVRAFRKFTYNGEQKKFNGAYSAKLSTSYTKLYATYTSSYVNKKNRTTNLKLACKAIDGTIVYPGKTFSFNSVVGKRTAAKGYKAATIFTGSNGTAQSLGGGVCQVASTMFNTSLKANLKIVQRHQHSQRVSYVPLGRDAAIYWGSEDFRFKNNTNYPIKIKMTCKDGKLTCAYYVCYDVKPKKVTLKVSRSGRNFTLRRYVDGKVNYTTKSHY